MKRFYLIIIVCINTLAALGQQHYIFKRLTVSDGLSSNYVNDLAQDRTGCIWAATEGGLNRFDGSRVTTFTVANSDLPSDELNALLADTLNNTLWIGTKRNGISVLDCNSMKFTQYTSEKDGIITNDITDFSPAADGGIWIVHFHLGIEHFNPQTNMFTQYRASQIKDMEGNFLCVADDGHGQLYIGSQDNGLCILNHKTRTCRIFLHQPNDPSSIPSNHIKKIFIDQTGNVWVGTNKGVALFHPQNGSFTTFQPDDEREGSLLSGQVNDIGQSTDGTLWICTQLGGVSTLNLNSNTFRSPEDIEFGNIGATNNLHGLSSPNARCFLQDKFGNIWIANYRGGIDFLSYEQPVFRTLEYTGVKDAAISNRQVWGINIDEHQRMWLGGENELAIFNKDKLERTLSLNGIALRNTHISTITKDKNGLLWLGLYQDGALTLDPETGHFSRIDFGESHIDVISFFEDKDKMWMATQQGIYSWYNGEAKYENELNHQLPDRMVHGIIRDHSGNLWVGTFGKGLIEFDKKNKLIRRFDETNGLTSNAINSLYMDRKGGLWIGHRNGLGYIADTTHPQIQVYNNAHGLKNLNVRAIIADRHDNIWISTNAGISEWVSQKQVFYNYTHQQGVPQGDFMDGSACIDAKGCIYFASQSGVCYFNPSEITHTNEAIPVYITEVKGYKNSSDSDENESIVPIHDKKIVLPYNENSFRITFNVVDYTLSTQTEYEYQMVGLGRTLYHLDNENQVTFRDLTPGHYKFKVRAKLRNQEWIDSFTTLDVVITPPFWLSWYAKLLYLLIICAAIYGGMTFYKRRLELENRLALEHQRHENDLELNNERLRFYTNITHELRTPLTLILGPLEDLLADKTLSPKHANKISIIRDSATRLLNLINQILEFRKTETQNRKLCVTYDNLGALIQSIGFRFKELNRNEKLSVNVEVDTTNTEMYFDADMITIIVDNLMSNAMKYTNEGSITLSLSCITEDDSRYAQIQVIDTGYGISHKALPNIFRRYYQEGGEHQASGSGIGLALVKSLVDLHEANIDVTSEIGKGTAFTIRLLADNTYPNALHKEKNTLSPSLEEVKDNKKAEVPPVVDEEIDENKPVLLVVEDNKEIRDYIRSSFEEMYTVITAANGQEGWQLAINRIPNIIVSDIMMPIMDGVKLCKMIKDDMRTSHIPVILLTAKDSTQDKEEGYEAGADSFLTKPFSARLLYRRIENLIESRRKLASIITSVAVPASITTPNNDNVNNTPASTDTNGDHFNATDKELKSAEESLNKLDRLFLEKVKNIINDHLSMEKMDVAFIADKMCMSHSTLYRKIKGLTNMSVNEFVRKLKMQKSIELLHAGEYSIAEISDMTGFSSVAYFRQCFKDEFGLAPTEYLKQQNKQ